MKKLCRIRLINWHYFENETLHLKGSALISGENTAGKSTILDAIQMVLTVSTRKFNQAANEKSSRDLKGYVRCKTGAEGNTFNRRGSIISYVALEFYEEKSQRYFILGSKIDSPDEESKLTLRWFREDCRLEDLSFLSGDRPSTAEEFRRDGRKVMLITQIGEAKDQFRRRLGGLEERFFEIIPKSVAFKPMDRVKDFINQFILSEKPVEVQTLRHNLAVLKELELLMDTTKAKITALDEILTKHKEILSLDQEMKVNDLLLQKADVEAHKEALSALEKTAYQKRQGLELWKSQSEGLKESLGRERERFNELQLSMGNNENSRMISAIQNRLDRLKSDQRTLSVGERKYKDALGLLEQAAVLLQKQGDSAFLLSLVNAIQAEKSGPEEKAQAIFEVNRQIKALLEGFRNERYQLNLLQESQSKQEKELKREIEGLKNKELTFPANTAALKAAIEKEFLQRGIDSPVRIFSDLLEITDDRWQNAVEGYLNTQRFYLLVEPETYPVALEVYRRTRERIHTVGLVNTGKLDVNGSPDVNSLAYVVRSENRWAKAYVCFLLGRVIRCDTTESLKEHKTAITAECMLYQNFAVRKISGEIYRIPYIGAHALEVQLKDRQEELRRLEIDMRQAQVRAALLKQLIERLDNCKPDDLKEYMHVPAQLQQKAAEIKQELLALKQAEDNPTYLQLQMQITECQKCVKEKSDEWEKQLREINRLDIELRMVCEQRNCLQAELTKLENQFRFMCEGDSQAAELCSQKYEIQVKSKSPDTIRQNFKGTNAGLYTKRGNLCGALVGMQKLFCERYECGFGDGVGQIEEYAEEHYKLTSSELIRYEEQLRQAKENCEQEFHESFLARLKENIESAKIEIRDLNMALQSVYYGDDCYKFKLSASKEKESLYRMIASRKNVADFPILQNQFEAEYRGEMDDLFQKLTAHDDRGERVVAEYTDYRSYLDYDIEIHKRDGTLEYFSKSYGEKSGGETQTPYYVAIAASFAQLYRREDTIRLILLDEAFDKMDDNRISAMLDFFHSQHLQMILAAPPAKVEVIGEKMDSILMVMREGASSVAEEYEL